LADNSQRCLRFKATLRPLMAFDAKRSGLKHMVSQTVRRGGLVTQETKQLILLRASLFPFRDACVNDGIGCDGDRAEPQ
jgi:hypothetical protein